MTHIASHPGIPALLDRLRETRDPGARRRAFRQVTIAAGGTVLVPDVNDNWGPLLVEVALFGITGWGNDMSEAIANWMKAAERRAIGTDHPAPNGSAVAA